MRQTNILRLRGAGMVSCLKPYLKSPNTMHALSALASLAGLCSLSFLDEFLLYDSIAIILPGPMLVAKASLSFN
jgi:hypothetical protein